MKEIVNNGVDVEEIEECSKELVKCQQGFVATYEGLTNVHVVFGCRTTGTA